MSDTPEITPEQVRAALADKAVQLIDVRQSQDWEKERIPNAVSGEDTAAVAALDRQATTVVYCYHGISSRPAAEKLRRHGFSDVASMTGGFAVWRQLYGADPEAVEQG